MDPKQKTESPRTQTKERLQSLDTLRGFDMVMLLGGGLIIVTLAEATGWRWLEVLATQQEHVDWVGFRFYDLIFPLFMFISGVAIPYAINSKVEKGIAKSKIDPQGKVFVHGEYWDAVSDETISEGTKVKVTEVKDNEIKVKKA